MDGSRFDTVTRSLCSRRATLGVLLGTALGFVREAAPAAARCKKGTKRCKKQCIPKRACCTTAQCRPASTGKVCRRRRCVCPSGTKSCAGICIHPDAVCPPAPNAVCDVPGNAEAGFPPDVRAAQTFTEPNGGRLNAVELYFRNLAPVTGTYLLQINSVDPVTGIPQNNTIASTTLPSSDAPNNLDLVTFGLGSPPTLVAGRQYAIVLSRPEGTGAYVLEFAEPGPCQGGELFTSFGAAGAFIPGVTTRDIYYRTFVTR